MLLSDLREFFFGYAISEVKHLHPGQILAQIVVGTDRFWTLRVVTWEHTVLDDYLRGTTGTQRWLLATKVSLVAARL